MRVLPLLLIIWIVSWAECENCHWSFCEGFAVPRQELETVGLDFDDSDEATLRFTVFGSEQVRSAPVGLDGVYRMSSGDHNLPQGLRGSWADTQTFVLEYDNIANNDHIIYRMRVEGSRVMMTVQETAHEPGVTFEGRLQNP
jgi:hypothetical protein